MIDLPIQQGKPLRPHSAFTRKHFPELVEQFPDGLPWFVIGQRPAVEWRKDAAALRDAGFPLAMTFNTQAEKLGPLRPVDEILRLHDICAACEQYDGRRCKLCSGCSGRGERKYLKEITTVGGKCFAEKPLW